MSETTPSTGNKEKIQNDNYPGERREVGPRKEHMCSAIPLQLRTYMCALCLLCEAACSFSTSKKSSNFLRVILAMKVKYLGHEPGTHTGPLPQLSGEAKHKGALKDAAEK
jgi:ferredoxin